MKISELPQDIKELALEYQKNETNEYYKKNSDNLNDAFEWSETKEGDAFWDEWDDKEPTSETLNFTKLEDETIIKNERENEFDILIKNTIKELQNLLLIKGKEYRRNNNPYHNFEIGSVMNGNTREEVLQGFLLKHLISVNDMRQDLKKGINPNEKQVNEKYNDILIYFMIEKAMMIENCKK